MENLTLLALLRDLQLKVSNVEKQVGPAGKDGGVGPQGERGSDGIQGLRGPQGLPGSDGLSGPQGEAGQDGEDGVGIESVSEAADGEIVFTLTDGSEHSVDVSGSLLRPSEGGDTVIYQQNSGRTLQEALSGQSGYEFTGGFADRADGQTGGDIGTNVQYTSAQATASAWRRFGFDRTRQIANDAAYFPTGPDYDSTKGLFGGSFMPEGVSDLFDFEDTSFSAAVTTGSLQYTAADGSYDLTQCRVGDLIKIRFSFNAIPQVQDSQLEVGLIYATRDANDAVTFTFPLTAQPISYPLVGKTFLNRIELSAYVASDEDLNARLLPAIRCNNEILIQPLSTLITVVR